MGQDSKKLSKYIEMAEKQINSSRRITNQDKFKLSQIMEATGLSGKDFYTEGDVSSFDIVYKYDSYFFCMERTSATLMALTVKGITDVHPSLHKVSYENMFTQFGTWAKELAAEVNCPTGWETIESENYLSAELADMSENYSAEEKVLVVAQISEFKERVKRLELPEEQFDVINKKLDDLALKIDTLNRFDWKSLFIGTIANLIMTFGVPPEAAGMLWEILKSSFTKRIAP